TCADTSSAMACRASSVCTHGPTSTVISGEMEGPVCAPVTSSSVQSTRALHRSSGSLSLRHLCQMIVVASEFGIRKDTWLPAGGAPAWAVKPYFSTPARAIESPNPGLVLCAHDVFVPSSVTPPTQVFLPRLTPAQSSSPASCGVSSTMTQDSSAPDSANSVV